MLVIGIYVLVIGIYVVGVSIDMVVIYMSIRKDYTTYLHTSHLTLLTLDSWKRGISLRYLALKEYYSTVLLYTFKPLLLYYKAKNSLIYSLYNNFLCRITSSHLYHINLYSSITIISL